MERTMTGNFPRRVATTVLLLAGLAASTPPQPLQDPSGSINGAFNVGGGFNNTVLRFAPGPTGSADLYVGGGFLSYQGTPAIRIVRLNSNGSIDSGFATGTGFGGGPGGIGYPTALAPVGNDDLYVGGGFTSYQGVAASRIVRLNSDGSVDTSFATGSGFTAPEFNAWIYGLALDPDGSGDVYVGGYFTSYNGTVRNGIVRLNADGTLDTAFNAGPGLGNGGITSLALAADGSGDVYIGGNFTSYNGTAANGILRLNSDGTVDTGFDSGSGFSGYNIHPFALSVPSDGSGDVVLGGYFTGYNGTAVNRIIRLNSNGTIDTAFNVGTGFNDIVESIACGAAGDVYVGGWFTSYNGTAINRIVRLNSDGTIDSSFTTGTGFNERVYGLAMVGDGSGDLYVGGAFTNFDGTNINRVVRLSADPPAPPPPPPPPSPSPVPLPNSSSTSFKSNVSPEDSDDILPCSAGTSTAPMAVLALASVVILGAAVRRFSRP